MFPISAEFRLKIDFKYVAKIKKQLSDVLGVN